LEVIYLDHLNGYECIESLLKMCREVSIVHEVYGDLGVEPEGMNASLSLLFLFHREGESIDGASKFGSLE
jgi:hypothetical protein